MRRTILALMLWPAAAAAEVPRVVTDIAPVHALAATVMDGVGVPVLLLDPTADPHSYQLRPSQARALAGADLAIWIGPALTPWLEGVIDGAGAARLDLLEVEPLPLRIEGPVGTFHDPERPAAADSHDGGHGHDHGGVDPHAWLDPLNGARFLTAIADRLAGIDPEHAATYRANAAAGAARLQALTDALRPALQPARDVLLIPSHDAYGYFLMRFDLRPAGALADGDAAAPGAARLGEIRARLETARRACLFTEPGTGASLAEAVRPGPDVPVLTLDPMGATLQPGPGLYEDVIRGLAAAIAECAAQTGAG